MTTSTPEVSMTSKEAKQAIRDELATFAGDPDKFPRALAAWLREHQLPVNGPVWTAAKAGERDLDKLAALAGQDTSTAAVGA